MKRLLLIVAALLTLLAACSPFETAPAPTMAPLPITPQYYPTDIPTPVPEPIYLNIIWYFHQPLYTIDPLTSLVTRPWVRINATRYYYGMASVLSKFPKVHETFNFSPILSQQLDAYASGARDVYWELSNRPASSLSDTDKLFMLTHFFDETAHNTIARYPRFKELYDKRGGADGTKLTDAVQSFSEQDIRDLQVWFNLVTFDPAMLAAPPLKGLIERGRDFTEDDKHTLFEVLLSTIRGIGPLYSQLQDSGQVELTTSPYAQPVLPLVLDTDAARDSNAPIQVPNPPFSSTQDAAEQLKRAKDSYQTHFGRQPRGLLPTGGAIDQNTVQAVSDAGFHWMVSGADVLTKSLALDTNKKLNGMSTTDALYRPYNVTSAGNAPLTLFFRDPVLSSLIPTAYAGMDAGKAAYDLINRIMKAKAALSQAHAAGSHLITLVIDGDAAWQSYPDDGHQFLNALYQRLTDAADRYDIQTVTPSEYLAKFPEQRTLSSVAAGSWGNNGTSDFSQWIGNPESNMAWVNLIKTRSFLADYLSGVKTTDPSALSKAYSALLLAEGADWFQPTPVQSDGDSGYFDRAYRALLGQVYANLGVPLPDFLQIPILPSQVISGDRALTGLITPTIDGIVVDNEWSNAGVVGNAGNTQPSGNGVVSALYYGANSENLYFRIDAREEWSAIASNVDSPQPLRVSIYLAKPDVASYSEFTHLGGDGDVRVALGMSATNVLEWELDTDGTSSTALYAASNNGGWSGTPTVIPPGAAVGNVLEIAGPIKSLGGIPDRAKVKFVVVVTRGGQVIARYPNNAVAQMTMPEQRTAAGISGRLIGTFSDPVGDDRGPGSYTYPTDGVFGPGSFDLTHAKISTDGQNLVFRVAFNAPINNVWSSPIGLSIQTIDIYIDTDPGKSSGLRKLLPGRNAALPQRDGWEYAIWVEGWSQQLFIPDAKGDATAQNTVTLKVDIDPSGAATIAVPLSALSAGGDPSTWGYTIAVLGQEAYPTDGVLRVRDVDPLASQWHFGGAPGDTNHTRIIDVLAPPDGNTTTDNGFGTYPSSRQSNATALSADDYTSVRVVTIGR